MPTGSVFAGDAAGGGVNIQQGSYTADFDTPTGGSPEFLSWVYESGDEILDLTDADSPLVNAGFHLAIITPSWNEGESGASALFEFTIAGAGFPHPVDLGLSVPGASTVGWDQFVAMKLIPDDGWPVRLSMFHDRVTDNLVGQVSIFVVRLFGGAAT